jgi:hypothetical protein
MNHITLPTVLIEHPLNSTYLAPCRMHSDMPPCGRRRAETQHVQRAPVLQQSFMWPAYDSHKGGKNVLIINKDFVEKLSQLCEGCTHDLCWFHYSYNYSFQERNRRHYICTTPCNCPLHMDRLLVCDMYLASEEIQAKSSLLWNTKTKANNNK